MKIRIVPKSRYETAGDYFIEYGELVFQTIDTGNDFYNCLILIHEIVEYFKAHKNMISIDTIESFDLSHLDLDEPGNAPDSPYRNEHQYAEAIEKIICLWVGEDFDKYEEELTKVMNKVYGESRPKD